MSGPPTALPLTDDDFAHRAQASLLRQLERLEELAEMGMRLARAVDAEVTAGTLAPAKAIVAVQRAGRGVRQCGLLQSRLLADLGRLRANERIFEAPRRAQAAAEAAQLADPAYGRKARVEAIVGRIARAQTRDEDETERLAAECTERLDDSDIYGDVRARPIGELVALICRDLDLDPDWERLSQEAWAQPELGRPGSPFAKFPPSRPLPVSAEAGRGGPSGEGSEHPMVEREGNLAAFIDSA